jgi:hypothetical protein
VGCHPPLGPPNLDKGSNGNGGRQRRHVDQQQFPRDAPLTEKRQVGQRAEDEHVDPEREDVTGERAMRWTRPVIDDRLRFHRWRILSVESPYRGRYRGAAAAAEGVSGGRLKSRPGGTRGHDPYTDLCAAGLATSNSADGPKCAAKKAAIPSHAIFRMREQNRILPATPRTVTLRGSGATCSRSRRRSVDRVRVGDMKGVVGTWQRFVNRSGHDFASPYTSDQAAIAAAACSG